MMNDLDKQFSVVKLIVRAIYGSMLIYAGLVYFRIPEIPYIWEANQQMIFFVLLAAIPIMFFISTFLGKQLLGTEKLAKKFAEGESGQKAAVDLVRVGVIVMAAVGEMCAMYGLALYFLSGDAIRPWIFFASGAFHYPLTMIKFYKAKEDIKRLSLNLSAGGILSSRLSQRLWGWHWRYCRLFLQPCEREGGSLLSLLPLTRYTP